MDFNTPFLPQALNLMLLGLMLLSTLWIALKIQWHRLIEEQRLHIWIFTVYFLCLMWILRASLESGVNVHLLGTTLIALMFGWRLAVLGISVVCAAVSWWGNIAYENLSVAIFVNAYFSVSFSYFIFLVVEAVLPRNVYIYLFISSFFGAALTFILTGTLSAIVLGYFQVYEWKYLWEMYLPFYYLLSFGEAFTTCGLVTMLIVYYPKWVYSFRDERYLNH